MSPSWKEAQIEKQMQMLLKAETEIETAKLAVKITASKLTAFTFQSLQKMKDDYQAQKRYLAGEGKGANARSVTAQSILDYRQTNKITQKNRQHLKTCQSEYDSSQQIGFQLRKTLNAETQGTSSAIQLTEQRSSVETSKVSLGQTKSSFQLQPVVNRNITSRYQTAQSLDHAPTNLKNPGSSSQAYVMLNQKSIESSDESRFIPRMRNKNAYRSQKIMSESFQPIDSSNNETNSGQAIVRQDSLTTKFFNKLREVNQKKDRLTRPTTAANTRSMKQTNSVRLMTSKGNTSTLSLNPKFQLKKPEWHNDDDSRQKYFNYKQSNLWSYVDEKHNPMAGSRPSLKIVIKPNPSVLSLKSKLNLSLFLKPQKQEERVPYMDMDKSGYGHKQDQMLSPKLKKFVSLGTKYGDQQSTDPVSPSKIQGQVSYGKYDYDVIAAVKDESEDEEDQVDFQIDQHTVESFSQYESTYFLKQISQLVFDLNKTSKMPQAQLQESLVQSELWFARGIGVTNPSEMLTAVQCYKQTLILNKINFVAMFNIAVLYFRLDKLTSAKRWFLKVIDIEPRMYQAYRAACITCFKLGDYQKAEELIDSGIKQLKIHRRNVVNKESGKQTDRNKKAEEEDIDSNAWHKSSQKLMMLIYEFMYLHALTYRSNLKFDLASAIYKKVRKAHMYNDRKRLIVSAFGILLLPMCEDRRQILNALDFFNKNITMYGMKDDPIARQLTKTFWNADESSWLYKFEDDIIEELRTRSFFKRFTATDLKPFLSKMSVKQNSYGQYLFPINQVCIILAGAIEVNSHEGSCAESHQIGRFQTGDIIGFAQGDGGITRNVQTWIVCISNVEAIWMDERDFAQLFAKQQKYQKRIFYESLKLQNMFKKFNENTLHMLAFELLEERRFKYGEVILKQHRRSVLNKFHHGFNRRQPNAIYVSIMAQRKILDQYTKDLGTSTFSLVLRECAKKAKNTLNAVEGEIVGAQQSVDSMTTRSFYTDNEGYVRSETLHRQKSDKKPKTVRDLYAAEESEPDRGVFIVESGRCSIVNSSLGQEKNAVFTEIYRSSLFGESNHLEVAGLDYFGSIIAGSVLAGQRDPSEETEVICLYLSDKNFQRIAIHELAKAYEVQLVDLEMYRNFAVRQFKTTKEEISLY